MKYDIVKEIGVITLVAAVCILIAFAIPSAHAETTYCNQQGDNKICNTYYDNGTMTSDIEHQTGENSSTKNRVIDTTDDE